MTEIGVMQNDMTLTFDSFEQLFRTLYLEIGDCILFMGSDLKVVQANERTCEVFELPHERLIGLRLSSSDRPPRPATIDSVNR